MTVTLPQPLADRLRARFGDDAEAALIEFAEAGLDRPAAGEWGEAVEVDWSDEEWAEIRRRQAVPLGGELSLDEVRARLDKHFEKLVAEHEASKERRRHG